MTEYFPLIMGVALFLMMIPVVYRIWVGPTVNYLFKAVKSRHSG